MQPKTTLQKRDQINMLAYTRLILPAVRAYNVFIILVCHDDKAQWRHYRASILVQSNAHA